MLRIMHVSNTYKPYQGGVVSSIVAQRAALEALGHQTCLVTFDFEGVTQEENVFCVPRFYSFTYRGNQMVIPRGAKTFLSTKIKEYQPDVIHIHHPFLLGQVAVELAKKFAVPSIFTYHTRYEDYIHYIPLLPRFLVRAACNYLIRCFCAHISAFIAPTVQVQKDIKRFFPAKPAIAIPSPLLSDFNRPYHIKSDLKPIVKLLTVSRFVVEKNIPFLLEACAYLSGVVYQFTLIGYGIYEEYLRWYAYQKLGLSEKQVTFLHVTDKKELAMQYAQADIFLFASQTETQGLVLAEAMSMGTPVIAVAGPGQSELVRDGDNGFLVCTPREMARAIIQVSSDAHLHEMMQRGAWRTAQRFHLPAVGKELERWYASICISPPFSSQ